MRDLVYICDAELFGGAEEYLKLLINALPEDCSIQLVAHPELEQSFAIVHPHFRFVPMPRSTWQWFQFCRSHREAIFHFNLPHYATGRVQAAIARLAGVYKTVATLHTLDADTVWQKSIKDSIGIWLFTSFDMVVAPSEYIKSLLVKFDLCPAEKIRVVHNGIAALEVVAVDRRQLPVPDNVFLVVAMGRLSPEKGFHYLLEAMAQLPERIYLALAGDGEEREKLEQQARQLGIEDRVAFLGYRKDRLNILKAADIFVLSSVQKSENLPYVVLEAMMLGIAVVATNVGGVSEQIIDQQTGVLVPEKDAKQLAAAIGHLQTHPDQAKAMAAQGHQRFEQYFQLSRLIDEMVSLYSTMS